MGLGYSHPVEMEEIEGITIEVPDPNKIIVKGIDNEKVGQFAAEIRTKRPPEPYKGYENRHGYGGTYGSSEDYCKSSKSYTSYSYYSSIGLRLAINY